MKNIFKKIGFLCTALLALSLGTSVNKVEAADTYTKATSITVGDTVVLVCESKKMELGSISTTSTKYGIGKEFTSSPVGAYPLEVVSGSSSGTYAFKNNGSYLYWTSGNSLATNSTLNANTSWKVTFDGNGNASILNGKDNIRKLRWNASSPRFACYTSDQTAVQLYKLEGSDGGSEETPDKTEDVKALFNEYLKTNTYTKDTALYTTDITEQEVSKYFHAQADTKYRRTVYESTSISMVTSENGTSYDKETYSRYEDKDNGVYHTGLNGDWWAPSDWKTVENKFVTLNDFAEYDDENESKMWKLENGEYVYELTPATATTEDDMTRMAREFVAPMWLAPNADNYQYAQFNKLTVGEKNNSLIMKLYIDKTENGKVDNEEGLFSQATITLGAKNILALATFEFGDNGNAAHVDGNSLGSAKSYTSEGYTLSLTSMTNVYGPAYDAKGNSCIKLGSGSKTGSFTFEVSEDVNEVIIYVAGYKAATSTNVKVNGTQTNVKTSSDNGEYTLIKVDTSTNKTVSFETITYRCMINAIEFC